MFFVKSREGWKIHGEFILTVDPSILGPQGCQIILPRSARRSPFLMRFVVLWSQPDDKFFRCFSRQRTGAVFTYIGGGSAMGCFFSGSQGNNF